MPSQTIPRMRKEIKASNQLGQVSEQPLDTQEINQRVTVGAASTALAASGSGTGRTVKIKPVSTGSVGAHVAYGVAATTSHHLVEPGEPEIVPWTGSAVNGIRGGASDIVVDVLVVKKA